MGHWSRDLGVLDLPQAVHRLTGQPAKLFGIEGRGLLREGYAADLMLFDPRTVARGPSGGPTICRRARRGSPPARSDCTACGSTVATWPTPRGSAPTRRAGRRGAEALCSLTRRATRCCGSYRK